jgi:hypothetical protein
LVDIAGLSFGLREGVIALIVVVALYMAFVLLRMRHLRLKREAAPVAPKPVEAPVLPEPVMAMQAERLPEPPRDFPPPSSADDPMLRRLNREVVQLREELDAVRGELAALRGDMQSEFSHMRAAQTVSPIYGDAMQMAVAGHEPAVIAERCGIARAEAELVVALAKSQHHH